MICSIIQLDQPRHDVFQPRETLSGTFRLVDVELEDVGHLEFSVVWYTEGKGDEDIGVHFFETLDWTNGMLGAAASGEDGLPSRNSVCRASETADDGACFRFSVTLPASPLSYYGMILKIHWCVRVRIFLKNGREVKSEKFFTVGRVPKVQVDLN